MTNLESRPAVRTVQIATEYTGQRIDNYLFHTLKGVPKSLIYRILRTGEVRVNGGRIRPTYRLQAGDQIRLPPLRLPTQESLTKPPSSLLRQLEHAILLEDAEVLVLNKPTGIAVHKGSGLPFGVIEALRALRPGPYLELAHRLDRDTSGCLVLAKTPQALAAVHKALRAGTMDKRYLALVCGRWEKGTCNVSLPLRKNVLRSGERRVEVLFDGKQSHTRFKPISLWQRATLLEATLHTGRTHQIRVHAAHSGHPVAGDDKYGDSHCNQSMRRLGLRRLFLHAHSIMFTLGKREVCVSAPLTQDLKDVVEQLETN
ncbi:MAG: RluA family pseudouridine synthase [Candidatus Competibacteraceae bacterium]|jgi:23S rRNA pseudouridine955/2504/2580 synthase|nr:RluA family pseudouridine synthase [Candidatus Competibacteraceae bacterium]